MWNFIGKIIGKFAVDKPIKKNTMLITPEQLKKVATTLSPERCEEMSDLLNELGAKYGVVSKDVFHEFAANVIQESGEFAHKRENMSYSAKRMVVVWPSRFKGVAAAQPFAHNPEALSNLVYGGRMGNSKPGDGWAFRGGGFIGLTGREVYTKYAKYAGYESVEACAEDVRNSDKAALDSAYWFFCVLKDLEDEADRNEIIGIIKSINGGLIGKDVRLMYYERCKKFIV